MVSFNAGDFVQLSFPYKFKSQAEDISVKFRTMRPSGMLIATASSARFDRMVLALQNGELQLHVNLGGGLRVFQLGTNLNDNDWHSVQVERRSYLLRLIIDGQVTRQGKFNVASNILWCPCLPMNIKDQEG